MGEWLGGCRQAGRQARGSHDYVRLVRLSWVRTYRVGVHELVVEALYHAHARLLLVVQRPQREGEGREALVHLVEHVAAGLELEVVGPVDGPLKHRRPRRRLARLACRPSIRPSLV